MTDLSLSRLLGRLRSETGGAALLAVVAVLALIWANSPWSHAYEELWETHGQVIVGTFSIDLSLHHWVNDGLMVLFFFLIGLEVRQELAVGSLRDRRRATVPLVAGLVGVLVPAAIYLAIAGSEAVEGWGVVIGTDTAFLLGAVALFGPRMSSQLRVFLLTLTVVDDFLAVSVIGVVYSDNLAVGPLLLALAALIVLALLGRARQWRSAPYILVIVVLWVATLKSGVHPSLAGMAAGLLVPASDPERSDVLQAKSLFRDYWQSPEAGVARTARRGLSRSISVNQRFQEVLRGPVALIVVPIFALANAGVDLRGGALSSSLGSSITWGVVAGLVVGKLVGVGAGTALAVRLGWGRLPDGVGPGSVAGGAALSGIGFTMSLLIVSLAFADDEQAQAATVGVLMAMALALLLGWLIFRFARNRLGETSADLPTRLDPDVDSRRDHVHGPDDAPFSLVEYLDFECPFCARTTGMWTDLKEHFGDRVQYTVRHLPLPPDVHPHAWEAALAAEAADRQGAFWEMFHRLFSHQDRLTHDDLLEHAAELGLDVERFEQDLQDPELHTRVQRDAESAHVSGARGTPTFFVNGVRNLGPHDARTLIAALEAATEPDSAAPPK